MLCQLCGKKIGLYRRFVDHEYCSAAHRREARTCLDRGLADFDENEELWAVTRSRRHAKSNSPSAQTASVLLLVVAAVLILATLSFSGGTTNSFSLATVTTSPTPSSSGSSSWVDRMGDSIGRTLRNRTGATLHEDFHSGFSEWVAASSRTAARLSDVGGGDWTFTAEGLKPGRLRIWKRSSTLANYEFDFVGQIDKKSMGWAHRALDSGNYYGTKLTIFKAGPGPNTSLTRYVKLNGREFDRVNLPLPLNLKPGEPYRVRVNVKEDRFVTFVNGQVISSWSDRRLRRGGVGFFSDDGESATVKWISLAERDSLLGQVIAYFSLIRLPLPPQLYEE